MKTKFKSKLLSILIGLVFITLLSVLLCINAYAAIEYEYAIYNLDDGLWYQFFSCCECGHEYFDFTDDPDDYTDAWARIGLEDWELVSDYCRYCYHGHLCENCHNDLSDDIACYECSLCWECWDDSIHCHQCGSCSEDLCQDCLEAEGWYVCLGCHTEASQCPGCGICMYPLHNYGAVCEDYGTPHCIYCDEEWICNECGECFFNYHDKFCSECEMCIDCAITTGLHCPYCADCIIDIGGCEGLEGVCLGCCIDIGNHCNICNEHIGDGGEWCRGGQGCGHCFPCADDGDWICTSCMRCEVCDDFQWCETCGYCEDCCHINAELQGCVCGEYCVEDGSFDDVDHLCSVCGVNFSCAVGFCEDCGLCIECCLLNSEDQGCVCGICVNSSEFEDHLCERCGLPFCAQGEPCNDCGYCQECCLDESSSRGCNCGLCAESDDFNSSEHLCEDCENNFSCNIDFCDSCGLCSECCERESELAGCSHGICVLSDDWEEHFCDICDKCKEDCSCGQECCANPGGEASGTHGTFVHIGSIIKQPTDKTRTVTKNTRVDRSENLVTFYISAYDPDHNVTYQWYEVEGDKAPRRLIDDTEYIVSTDDILIIVSGATTNKLTVAVPANACSVSYSYYCVVTSATDETFQSESAFLYGRHNYGYVWTSLNSHSHGCIGCGEIDKQSEKPHEIGPWKYSHYATATQGALIIRECRVCGGIAESKTTEPLGEHPYHTYIYQPVYVAGENGNMVSHYHEKICLCGRKGSVKEEHVWSAWVITKFADEQHTGSKYHDCAVCNYRETVTIKRQTHDHFYCFDIDESPTGITSLTDYNNKYHWAYCIYPGCHAEAYKEEHQFDNWYIKDIPYNVENKTDRLVWRTCKICGYSETKEIKSGYKALVVTNGNIRAQSVDYFGGDFPVHTATAKPPEGYYFDHWEVVCPEGYTAEDLFDFSWGYWQTRKLSDGSTKSELIYTTIYDETIAFRLVHQWEESYKIVYHLKAVCYRYENELVVYPNGDKSDCYFLGEGDTVATNYNPKETGVSKEDSVVWVESIEEKQFGWVIYYEGEDRGERTMTVHLNGYRGGPLEVTSYEQAQGEGLPCNLHIIVDKDSVITTNGTGAIWGCSVGGDVIISSTNGATLTIRVNGINPYSGEVYGICTSKAPNGFGSKVSLQGNVKVNICVTNQGNGFKQNSVAIGIYTPTQVEVLNDASLTIEAISWDNGEDSKSLTAYAIQAGKELRINTTGCVELKVTGVNKEAGKKGQGVQAKAVYVDNVDHFYIDYNTNVRSGSNAKPQYDAKKFIEYTMEMDGFNRRVVEQGYRVTFVQKNSDIAPIIDVERWYQNDLGQYLVRKDENISFSVIPALGYYDPELYIDGMRLDGYRNEDGVTISYCVYSVDRDIVINVYAGTEFNPFVSQPAVSQRNVYYLTDARLSYRLNGTDALYYHSLFGGEMSTDPMFKKEMGKYADPDADLELIATNFTINKVFLQRYNALSGTYTNTGISFDASAIGEVTFNDGAKNVGETIRYRLVIVFDGREYVSDTFAVTWTENQEDVAEPVVNMVELHIKNSRYDDYEGGKFDAGDARIILNSEKPYYIYSATLKQGFRGNAMDLLRSQRSGENPVVVAEFNYHTGTLILNGTRYTIDFNGDGTISVDERINIDGEILSIRVADESSMGGLIINVLRNTTIGGSFDDYGWNNSQHYFGMESTINNEYGFIRIKSTNAEFSEPDFNIIRTSKSHDIEGILAMGAVYIEGNINVNVTLSADDDITVSANGDRFGIYAHDIIMRGNAKYTYEGLVSNKSKTLLGQSFAIYSEYGNLKMFDNSYVVIKASASYKSVHDDYNTIYVVGLSVVQNASMYIETKGDINVPIYSASDILFATTGAVRICSMAELSNTYGIYCQEGNFEVRYPTTFIYETEYMGDLMKSGEFVLVGRYTHYDKRGCDKYYPGDNYSVSVIMADDMEYYFSQFDYEITESDYTVLKTGFNYKSLSQNVRAGDIVKITASEPKHGFEFNGWEIISAKTIEDIKFESDNRCISFTMPECAVELYPLYTCTAFDDASIYTIVKDVESKYATLFWQVEASKNLTDAHLEKLNDKGEWVALEWKLTFENSYSYANGKTVFKGEQKLKLEGIEGEGKELQDIGTYRIVASSNDGYYADYDLYSEPFVIDFEGGLHILVSEDAYNPTLAIPAGYVGTEYNLYISDYVYADYDLSYEFNLGSLYDAISSGDIEFSLNGRVATFKRNATHDALGALEGNLYFKVIDSKTQKEFYIPFDFGEITNETEHDWGEVVYEWSEDGTKLTATRVCKNNKNHVETETVNVVSEVFEQPTCSMYGKTKYTSMEFSNIAFKVQTRTLTDIDTVSHKPVVVTENEVKATCKQEGHYDKVTYCEYCKKELSRELQVLVVDNTAHEYGEWVVTQPAKIGEKGTEERTCVHCGEKELRDIPSLPYIPLETEEGMIYVETLPQSGTKNITDLFSQAKEENGIVEITADNFKVTFDSDAVSAIGGNNVTLSAQVITEDIEVEGAELVLEISLDGALFAGGKALISIPFDKEVPMGKMVKVYYIDEDGSKTDMNAIFEDGEVQFTIEHCSTYAVMFEDIEKTEPEKNGIGAGAIILVIVCVVAVLGGGFTAVYFFVIKKKKYF